MFYVLVNKKDDFDSISCFQINYILLDIAVTL